MQMCKLKTILAPSKDSYVYHDSNQNKWVAVLLKAHNIVGWKCYILLNICSHCNSYIGVKKTSIVAIDKKI
jgi:hypothetical protein